MTIWTASSSSLLPFLSYPSDEVFLFEQYWGTPRSPTEGGCPLHSRFENISGSRKIRDDSYPYPMAPPRPMAVRSQKGAPDQLLGKVHFVCWKPIENDRPL